MENGHAPAAPPSAEYTPPFGPEEVRTVPARWAAAAAAGGEQALHSGALPPSPASRSSLNSRPLAALAPLQWRKMGHAMVDFIADYQAGIEQMPVRSQVQPGYLR